MQYYPNYQAISGFVSKNLLSDLYNYSISKYLQILSLPDKEQIIRIL